MSSDTEAVDPPDGGWGWVVVFGVFISSALIFGANIVYPLFFPPMMEEFGIGFGEVTWLTGFFEIGKAIGYLATPGLVVALGYRGTCMLVSIVSGLSLSVASVGQHPWFNFVLAGAFPGLTMGLFATLLNVITARYFTKRRLLAAGLGQTGSAVGTLVLSPLIQYFIDSYGWRGGMLLFGGITLNATVACSLFRPIHLKSDETNDDKEVANPCKTLLTSGMQILKVPKVWLLCAVFFGVFGGVRVYMRFLVPYAQDVLNVDPMISSFLLSVYSIVSIFSRAGFGALGDVKWINPVWVLIVTQTLTAVISTCVWFVTDYTGLMVNSVAHSIANGSIHTMYLSVIINIIGEKNLTWGYTVIGFVSSVIGAAIVPLTGMLVDATEEMRYAFITATGLVMLTVILHIPLLQQKKEEQKQDDENCCQHTF